MTNDDLAVFRERNTRKSLSNAAALIGKANDAVFEVCRPCFLASNFPIFIVMIPYNQHCIFMRFCRILIHYRKIKDAFAPLSRLKSLILR